MRFRLIAFIVAVVALAPASAHAALTAGGPWVPNISGLAVVNDSTWLATTSPALNLSRTTDGGRSWKAVVSVGLKTGDAPQSVSGVAAAGGVVFAVGEHSREAGVMTFGTSTDGGATWSWRSTRLKAYVQRVIADPANPQRIAILTSEPRTSASMGGMGLQLLVSEDQGATWRKVGAVPSSEIKVGGDGTLYAGLNRSTDWGVSWQPFSGPVTSGVFDPYGPTPYGMSGLAVVASVTGRSDVVTIATSTDRGATWTYGSESFSKSACTSGCLSTGVAAGPDGQIVVLGTDGVRLVRADGSTVANFPERPVTPSGQSWIVGGEAIVPTASGVLAVSAGGAENRSTGIASYGGLDSLVVSTFDRNLMLASTGSGLYRTADGGGTWIYAGNAAVVGLSTASRSAARVSSDYTWAQAADGMYNAVTTARFEVSNDGGATWTPGATLVGYGPPASGSNGIVWAGDSRVYAILESNGTCVLVRSDDRLATVTQLSIPSGCAKGAEIAASPDNPDLVFALVRTQGTQGWDVTVVYRSGDGGVSWSPVSLPDQQLKRINQVQYSGKMAIGPGKTPPIAYWYADTVGVCGSTNLGATFTCSSVPQFSFAVESGSVFAGIRGLNYQPDGAVVASLGLSAWRTRGQVERQSIVVRSFDNAKTWATTENMAAFPATQAFDITGGKASRQGGKKKSPAGKRRFALASVGVVRQTLNFALLAKPEVRTTGITASRAGGGRVTVPLVCKPKFRCSGRIEGQMRIGGKNYSLATTRFDIRSSKSVSVGIAKKSQRAFKSARGTGTIRLIVRYTEKKQASFTTSRPVTVR